MTRRSQVAISPLSKMSLPTVRTRRPVLSLLLEAAMEFLGSGIRLRPRSALSGLAFGRKAVVGPEARASGAVRVGAVVVTVGAEGADAGALLDVAGAEGAVMVAVS